MPYFVPFASSWFNLIGSLLIMKTLKRRIMTWLIILFSLYAIYCGLLFFFQTKLIFPASMAGQAGNLLPTVDTQVIALRTEQGTTTAWLIPSADASGDTPAPLAVFFHGNAELMDHQHAIIDLYHSLGVSVLMVEYRGYGHSEGTPSESHIVADTLEVLEQVLQRDDVAKDKLVLHGRSIGGGMAAQVALKTKSTAMIVESTFTSVSGMAMRFGVPPFIVTSPLKSEDAFKQLSLPTLIMHGRRDSIVSGSHAARLAAAAKDSTVVMFDSDHNDLPNGSEVTLYRNEVEALLKRAGVLPE